MHVNHLPTSGPQGNITSQRPGDKTAFLSCFPVNQFTSFAKPRFFSNADITTPENRSQRPPTKRVMSAWYYTFETEK